MSEKRVRSFTVDPETDDRMREDDETNWSAAIRNFCQHYISIGSGEEAALRVRLEQLDDEIADTRKELDKLQREKEQVEQRLEDRRTLLDDVVDEIAEMVEEGHFTEDQLDPSNEAIKNFAEKAEVSPQRVVEEVRGRLW